MMTYGLRTGIFRTRWMWFAKPIDVDHVSENVTFSYENVPAPGFKKKQGLTTIINLLQSEDALRKGMREKFIRKQIKRGEEAGIVFRMSTTEEFLRIYREFRRARHLPRERVDEVARKGIVVAAEYRGVPLSVGLFIGDGVQARAYALASVRFSDEGHTRELVGYANRILIWEIIRMLKKNGYQELDLGGIEPDSKDPNQRSLAEFKEAFGGERRPCFYYRKTYSPFLRWWRRIRSYLS